MNTILLQPTDVLFFRDGRPMGGASAGHGAAWPLPTVVNHAFHAALHRAGEVFNDAHPHRRGRSGVYEEARDRRFGALVTAGPFPVCTGGTDLTWFFPRPADADDTGGVFLHPYRGGAVSSLPLPCKYPVVSTNPPSKATFKPWWSEGAWNAYLGSSERSELSAGPLFKSDSHFADTEHTYCIGINPDTGTVEEGQFYSANYLRLREGFRLGLFAEAMDKLNGMPNQKRDLIKELLNGHPEQIVVGGQQRICTASRSGITGRLPLPLGLTEGFARHEGKWLVKWILLTPAIWPEIRSLKKDGRPQDAHPGGWLPNWICLDWDEAARQARPNERNGHVLLTDGFGVRKAARKGGPPGTAMGARLVAALVPKPIPVTGWALPNDSDRPEGGAKSTHLGTPAGAVYYFEADSQEQATALANALNWHGATAGTEIKNRRSTLMGEKGFGLGVCGTWDFYGGTPAK
jgi:CRISPR-associated protein Cmr3